MSDKEYRPGLPEMPPQIKRLPVLRGYPVPWFVAKIKGQFDFRVADARKIKPAVHKRLCWVCGQKMGKEFVFVVGPMCTINLTSAEPPMHRECALWSARACPFLLNREKKRRENNLPEEAREVGIMIKRQPEVSALWTCTGYRVQPDGRGNVLFRLGKLSDDIIWMKEGRDATREEVEESMRTVQASLLFLRSAEALGS
jgi:hypothetical protein